MRENGAGAGNLGEIWTRNLDAKFGVVNLTQILGRNLAEICARNLICLVNLINSALKFTRENLARFCRLNFKFCASGSSNLHKFRAQNLANFKPQIFARQPEIQAFSQSNLDNKSDKS